MNSPLAALAAPLLGVPTPDRVPPFLPCSLGQSESVPLVFFEKQGRASCSILSLLVPAPAFSVCLFLAGSRPLGLSLLSLGWFLSREP